VWALRVTGWGSVVKSFLGTAWSQWLPFVDGTKSQRGRWRSERGVVGWEGVGLAGDAVGIRDGEFSWNGMVSMTASWWMGRGANGDVGVPRGGVVGWEGVALRGTS
jgi:hypothetical protein